MVDANCPEMQKVLERAAKAVGHVNVGDVRGRLIALAKFVFEQLVRGIS